MRRELDIGPDETAPELAARIAETGAPLMADTLRKLERREIVPVLQDRSQATFAPRLKREDGQINWSLAARQIYNRIRGLHPWPGAFTSFRGENCHIGGRAVEWENVIGPPGTLIAKGGDLAVVCGEQTTLQLEFVKLEGRKQIAAREFMNGARLVPGERFL
jgi:methionyl-tRNA formyltransferase